MGERTKTAYHEAGHAVLAYYRGILMVSATIMPQEGANGLVQLDKFPRGWEIGSYGDPLTAWYIGMAMVDLAGVYATAILTGTELDWTPEDPERIDVNMRVDIEGTDYFDLRSISSELDKDGLSRVSEETEQVLRENWHAVEAVANALLMRKTLNKTKLYEVLEKAQCAKDEKATALVEKAYRNAELERLCDRRWEIYDILERKEHEGSSEAELTKLKMEIVEIESKMEELSEGLR